MDNNTIDNYYIHYHAANYKRYGIYKNLGNNNYGTVYSEASGKLKSEIAGLGVFSEKQSFEDALNAFTSKEDKSKKNEEAQAAITDLLLKEFGNSLRSINWNTLNVDSSKLIQARKNTEAAIKTAIDETTDTYLNTIRNRMDLIEKALDTVKDVKTKKELRGKISHIYDLLKQITKVTSREKFKALDNMLLSPEELTKKGENVITLINSLLKNADLFALNTALQKGELFEYTIAAIAAQAQVTGINSLKETMNKMKKGQDRTQVKIDFNEMEFLKGIDFDKINQEIKGYSADKSSYIMVSNLSTQGKLDVEITWGGQPALISAKNVNLNSGYDVHIVSDSSLLYLLQDEGSAFLAHYMNITAEHKDGNLQQEYQKFIELTRQIILFKALSGKTVGKENLSANVFVINDNKTGKVRVFDISELLQKAYDLNGYVITANDKDFNSVILNNPWHDSGYEPRLTDVVISMIKQKINASLKPGLFKE